MLPLIKTKVQTSTWPRGRIIILLAVVAFITIYGLLAYSAVGFKNFVRGSKSVTEKKPVVKRHKFDLLAGGRRGDTKGILTRYGFISLNNIDDESFLSQGEISSVSGFFMLDYFDEELNKTLKTNLTKPIQTFGSFRKFKKAKTTEPPKRVWKPICPMLPPDLAGAVQKKVDDLNPPTMDRIARENPKVKFGGKYAPDNCVPRSKIAIIIPLRGRETQLRVLLAHMHPIWQRQQLDYSIYTVSQVDNGHLFNKAKLLNAGFLEASKDYDYDCYVFHDVDMTLEDDRCLYRCASSDNPRELSVFLDKFEYQELKYHLRCRPDEYPDAVFAKYFGGVSMMTKKQIYDVNGYSNLFWGWGSEDIDIYLRLWQRGYYIAQPYGRRCSYHMIKHETESSNAKNEGRFALLRHAISRMRYEGITSLRYKILSKEPHRLYTNITLDVGKPLAKYEEFMGTKYDTMEEACHAQVPWD